jgi:hypothetical protein
LRKPESDTVADKVGFVGTYLAMVFGSAPGGLLVTQKDVDSLCLYALKGKRIPGELPSVERLRLGFRAKP